VSHSPSAENESRNDASGGDASDSSARDEDWFSQTETLDALVQLVRDEKLVELEIVRGAARVHLKKAQAPAFRPPTDFLSDLSSPSQFVAAPSDPFSHAAPDDSSFIEAGATSTTSVAADANVITVVSPMVGIFYRAPSPSDPNFVEVGDRVELGQTLGLVETMKVFNEITSEWEGTVVEVIAQSSQLLETGDRLMTIRK